MTPGRLDSIRWIGDDVLMTVVNESSRVPPVDAAARQRLTAALDRDGVVAAMLIGSQARGEVGPLSDVDIAVWHEPDLDPSLRLRLQLDLIEAAEGALGTALCGGRIDEGTFGRRPAR